MTCALTNAEPTHLFDVTVQLFNDSGFIAINYATVSAITVRTAVYIAYSTPLHYALVIGVIFWFLLERTPFGVEVRAIGGNRKAAIANGIKVARVDTAIYILGGMTASFAGVIYAARVGSGQVAAGGSGTTLSVITAVLIGGVSLLGGLGSITGVAVGAILLSEINNALIFAQIPPQYNTIVVGFILIAAVAIDHVRRERLYRVRR